MGGITKGPILRALLWPFLYQAVGLACLWHWGSADPWRALDRFSGGFVALSFVLLLYEIRFNRGILTSRETMREASGLTYDPATIKWGSVLAIADLSVFLDYGHWHLTPALRVPSLQTAGLLLYGCAVAGLMWTDTCLARHFQAAENDRQLMTTGPFGLVRHPRYSFLVLSKLAFCLVFASVLAWASLLVSMLLLRRRIRLEEAHLQEIFGSAYSSYMERMPRFLPGIY